MHANRRVAILIPGQFGYLEGVLRGVVEYAATRPGWSTMWVEPEAHLMPRVAAWNPHGAIAYLYSKPQAADVLTLGVPTINIGGNLHVEGTPRVSVENEKVAELAADYFWKQGHRQFACVSTRRRWFHKLRDDAFVAAIARRGQACELFTGWFDSMGNLRPDQADPFKALRAWLSKLPKPCALFAVQDSIAVAVIEAAQELGIRVPEDIAVLGADNSTTLCQLANPNLSSIELALEEIGRAAGQMLDTLMDGRKLKHETELIPPMRVVERRSTETVATADAEVNAAMRYIHAHADEPITVEKVLREVLVSRRLLEQKFRKTLGCTPLVAIHRAHVQRAMRLLAETDLPMPTVAERSGFSDAEHMCKVFQLRMKQTPTAYRKRVRYHQ